MITSAKNRPMQLSDLPQMGEALEGLFQPMYFIIITKQQVNHETVESEASVKTQGVRQPLSANAIAMKPEKQRAWKWDRLHCLPSLQLQQDDICQYLGVRYRVMARTDYPEYGYLEYHMVEDYQVTQDGG